MECLTPGRQCDQGCARIVQSTNVIETLEAEEREWLAPALARMRAEQAVLRQQVQERGAS